MALSIHTTVFEPASEGQGYVVVASTFSHDHHIARRWRRQLRAIVHTRAEVAAKCCELASELRNLIEQQGGKVRASRCSHCPSAPKPHCGAFAKTR